MIERITCVESNQFDPYYNLAVEEHLLLHCQPCECILYLWQNQNTIVIGKNQNAWAECRVESLKNDGGVLARRLSGGGAVYHDLGNLNFTFLVSRENYNISRQLNVILQAVRKLGAYAEKSGRNDILIHGCKFSGNAFYEQGIHCYHHGTIMVDVDTEKLSRYLTVSKEKLRSKGVESVRSRVTNLREHIPNLTIDALKDALIEAFEEEYGGRSKKRGLTISEQRTIQERALYFSSWDWLYGRKLDFQHEKTKRFSWGQVTLQFRINRGRIEDIEVYSDSLCPDVIGRIPELLRGSRYQRETIVQALKEHQETGIQQIQMLSDIQDWLMEEEL